MKDVKFFPYWYIGILIAMFAISGAVLVFK